MIRSIRYFLLISLLLSITLASAVTAIGNYLLDEQVVQPFLDSQLVKIAAFVNVINQTNNVKANNDLIEKNIRNFLHDAEHSSLDNIVFQVWDNNGKLLLHSLHPTLYSLKNSPAGYNDIQVGEDNWRVYAMIDAKTKVKIVVAELYNIRHELVDDIARGNGYILLVTYPLFGILVWVIISIALRSITRVTNEISNRASTYLEPVEQTHVPIEIKPMIKELNQLFIRLKLAFERNKRFAADAAHELRTPLAALRTHAQVAVKSTNEDDRTVALQKVLIGVDRSSHVVAQLLTLSRLGEEDSLGDIKPVDLHKIATEIIAAIAPLALDKNIEIELSPAPDDAIILGNDIALGILIRNVVDNAIRYTPTYGAVIVDIINTSNHIIFRVTDSGPGIPVELRERVFERFFRILGTTATGSGLGLAIVGQITELHHAVITLNTPPNGKGLQFDVTFPKYRGD